MDCNKKGNYPYNINITGAQKVSGRSRSFSLGAPTQKGKGNVAAALGKFYKKKLDR